MGLNNIKLARFLFLSKPSILFIIFFITAPITLFTSIACLSAYTRYKINQPVIANSGNYLNNPQQGVQLFASLPNIIPSMYSEVVESDARPEIVKQYLNKHDSPIEHLAQFIVETADKYNVDYRLITAISQQESNLCKKIPEGSYNCWGWGIHSRGTLGFSSYEEGIEIVTHGIKANYIDEGYGTPNEIMKKYTPLSQGSWAEGVSLFLSQMQ